MLKSQSCRPGGGSQHCRTSAKEPNDQESIKKSFARHLEYSLACTRFNFSMQDLPRAVRFLLVVEGPPCPSPSKQKKGGV